MTQVRIRWNHDERLKIARASRAFYLQGMDKLSAVRRAQAEVLPVDRQREILQLSAFAVWLDPMWEMLGGKEFAEARIEPNLVEEESPPVVTLEQFSTEDLWAELGRRLFERPKLEVIAQQAVHHALANIIPGYQEPERAPEPIKVEPGIAALPGETSARKPKILIIGLTNSQIQEVKNRMADRLNFLFEPGTASENRCRSLAGNHDLTIRTRWTNNISLKGIPNVLHLTGGMSTIFAALEERYPNN